MPTQPTGKPAIPIAVAAILIAALAVATALIRHWQQPDPVARFVKLAPADAPASTPPPETAPGRRHPGPQFD